MVFQEHSDVRCTDTVDLKTWVMIVSWRFRIPIVAKHVAQSQLGAMLVIGSFIVEIKNRVFLKFKIVYV